MQRCIESGDSKLIRSRSVAIQIGWHPNRSSLRVSPNICCLDLAIFVAGDARIRGAEQCVEILLELVVCEDLCQVLLRQ